MMTTAEGLGSGSRERAYTAEGWNDTHLVKTLELIQACGLRPEDPIIDVGGAAEPLAIELIASGYSDITVVDASLGALEVLGEHLSGASRRLTLMHQELTHFRPHRRYALWIDTGLFHYLRHPDDRQEYVEVLQQALRAEGHLVIATYGPDAPDELHGVPVTRYSPQRLLAALGTQFELGEHSLAVHGCAVGGGHQFLHGHFRRHAPCWPS